MHRRAFIAACGCIVFGGANGAIAQEDDFFVCGAEQITDVATSLQNLSNSESDVSLGNLSSSEDNDGVTLDPYSTAQRSLRWTAAKARREHDGKPSVLIGFVDGSADQQQAVRSVSNEWLRHDIDVHFEFTSKLDEALVRISFDGGNQSATGIGALSGEYRGRATMHLGDVRPGASARRIRRVVLHEFGHGIMTFGHEHRHPDAGFRFKSDAHIRDSINSMLPLGATPWSIGKVQTNITNPPYARNRVCGPYDVTSIMHYPVLTDWLEAGSPVPQEPADLSPIDIGCAAETYR